MEAQLAIAPGRPALLLIRRGGGRRRRRAAPAAAAASAAVSSAALDLPASCPPPSNRAVALGPVRRWLLVSLPDDPPFVPDLSSPSPSDASLPPSASGSLTAFSRFACVWSGPAASPPLPPLRVRGKLARTRSLAPPSPPSRMRLPQSQYSLFTAPPHRPPLSPSSSSSSLASIRLRS
jgi:hypothetical protein